MATSQHPDAEPSSNADANSGPKHAKAEHRADFYDTQFIVGRIKGDQRKSRTRFYAAVIALVVAIFALYTLTARRAEAPKSLKTNPVVVPAPAQTQPSPVKDKPGHKPQHR